MRGSVGRIDMTAQLSCPRPSRTVRASSGCAGEAAQTWVTVAKTARSRRPRRHGRSRAGTTRLTPEGGETIRTRQLVLSRGTLPAISHSERARDHQPQGTHESAIASAEAHGALGHNRRGPSCL
jgi:hypothetical protein